MLTMCNCFCFISPWTATHVHRCFSIEGTRSEVSLQHKTNGVDCLSLHVDLAQDVVAGYLRCQTQPSLVWTAVSSYRGFGGRKETEDEEKRKRVDHKRERAAECVTVGLTGMAFGWAYRYLKRELLLFPAAMG